MSDEITIDGQRAEGHIIKNEGARLRQRKVLDFVGAGINVADASGKTIVTVSLDTVAADARYLKLNTSNDPLTGELVITPASGTTALRSNADIVIKSGKKLVFDGA
jgi:hypothetical protein